MQTARAFTSILVGLALGSAPGARQARAATTSPVGWAKVGPDGNVLEVGVTVPFATLTSSPPSGDLAIPLAQQAQLLTRLNHVGLDFEAQGHPPPPYQVPHFDVHFYLLTPEEQVAVDCTSEPMPAAEALPSGYVIPGTGAEPNGTCVPQMGVHAVNTASPELSPSNPQPFTSTLILGYHDGRLAFIEPMIAEDQLAAKQSIALDVPVPAERPCGSWPTKFRAAYDPQRDAYDFVLSDFQPHD